MNIEKGYMEEQKIISSLDNNDQDLGFQGMIYNKGFTYCLGAFLI